MSLVTEQNLQKKKMLFIRFYEHAFHESGWFMCALFAVSRRHWEIYSNAKTLGVKWDADSALTQLYCPYILMGKLINK